MIEINKEIKEIIEDNAIGLATVDSNGNPHNIAIAYIKVIEKNKLIITDVGMQETIKNIKQNKNIALIVWNKNWEKHCIGYELKGTAEYFKEGKWINFVNNLPENKDMKPKGAIVVKINKIKILS